MRKFVAPLPMTGSCKGNLSRRRAMALALTSAGILLTRAVAPAYAQTAVTSAKAAEVHIDNFAFTPAELTVAVGTTVTWTNRDDIPHTVVEKGVAFRSKPMDTDEQYSHTFDTPGEVSYFCSLHPHMTGKIIVKP